jgi:uncharacterized protein
MKLSDGEKLILVMLAEIYKHLDIKGEINPELVLSSIFHAQTWGLNWEYGELLNTPEEDPDVVQETTNILDMFRLLTPSYDKLSQSDKDRIEKEAAPFGGDDTKFQGFDGNNDPHYGVVRYLVKDLERYDELTNAPLNSHSSATLGKYRRMLAVYNTMLDPYPQEGLSADQIIQILKR